MRPALRFVTRLKISVSTSSLSSPEDVSREIPTFSRSAAAFLMIYFTGMGKYLFFDVDRTLLDSRDLTVPHSAETALRMAADNGHHLFLCTGRSVYSLKDLKELPIEGIIFCNGAGIELNGRVIRSRTIPEETVRKTIGLAERSRSGLLVQGYERAWSDPISTARTEWIIEQKRQISEGASQRVSTLLSGEPISAYDGSSVYKMDVYFEKEADIEMFRREIDPSMSFICMLSTMGNRRNGGEITMPGVNKGGALKWLCTQLGADESDAYGFGDSLNDLAMLEACGTGIAMGDGEAELKEKADYITTGLHEDGILNAMKHFGLI